jgi:hypothetical protein
MFAYGSDGTGSNGSTDVGELGSQGSNLILGIQSAPCFQLHHSPNDPRRTAEPILRCPRA